MGNPRGQAAIDAKRKWTAANPRPSAPYNAHKRELARDREAIKKCAITKCYLKEARAIPAGKDVRGRNRCTKLVGD